MTKYLVNTSIFISGLVEISTTDGGLNVIIVKGPKQENTSMIVGEVPNQDQEVMQLVSVLVLLRNEADRLAQSTLGQGAPPMSVVQTQERN